MTIDTLTAPIHHSNECEITAHRSACSAHLPACRGCEHPDPTGTPVPAPGGAHLGGRLSAAPPAPPTTQTQSAAPPTCIPSLCFTRGCFVLPARNGKTPTRARVKLLPGGQDAAAQGSALSPRPCWGCWRGAGFPEALRAAWLPAQRPGQAFEGATCSPARCTLLKSWPAALLPLK